MIYDEEHLSDFLIASPREYQSETTDIADFIARRTLAHHRSFVTSNDIEEKLDHLEALTNLNTSLLLLVLSNLTEDRAMIDAAKNIYRETTI